MKAFDDADVLFLTDIYPAGEAPIPGISAEKLAEDVRQQGHKSVEYLGDFKSSVNKIAPKLQKGDLFITLGAGNIHTFGDQLLKALD